MDEGFSVVEFAEDGTAEYVRRGVDIDAAVNAFASCIGTKDESKRRVIILLGAEIHIEWTPQTGMSYARKAAI